MVELRQNHWLNLIVVKSVQLTNLFFRIVSVAEIKQIKIYNAKMFDIKFMGIARGKSGWGSFPKVRRPGAGCGAEPHVVPQAKIFWVLDGGGIPRI